MLAASGDDGILRQGITEGRIRLLGPGGLLREERVVGVKAIGLPDDQREEA